MVEGGSIRQYRQGRFNSPAVATRLYKVLQRKEGRRRVVILGRLASQNVRPQFFYPSPQQCRGETVFVGIFILISDVSLEMSFINPKKPCVETSSMDCHLVM